MKSKIFKTIKNPKLYAFGLVGILSVSSLSRCADKRMGEILNLEVESENQEVYTKTFNPGEHIISESYLYTAVSDKSQQYPYHPGYIIVDIEQIRNVVTFFYQNEKTVECTSNENGEFIEFGTPVEQKNFNFKITTFLGSYFIFKNIDFL